MKCPVRPPFSYAGGKQTIAKWVISHLPRSGVKRYVETCVGSGAILCALPKPYPEEVINDLDGGVSSFWLALRDHTKELIRKKELTPYSRVEWLAAREKIRNEGYPEDVVEAARLFVIMVCQNFGHINCTNSGWLMPKPGHMMMGPEWVGRDKTWTEVALRLRSVVIDRADMIDILRRHDSPSTLVYLDPPYFDGTHVLSDYGDAGHVDHEEMARTLLSCSSMVVLSGYPSQEYMDWFSEWACISITTITHIGSHSGSCAERRECLWINPAAQAALARDGQQLSLFE